MIKYKIVDTIFELNFISKSFFDSRLREYLFETNQETQYFINFVALDNINATEGEILKASATGTRYVNNGTVIDDLYIKDEIVTKVIYEKNKYTIFIKKNIKDIHLREYAISTMLFSEIMRKENKIIIHASAIRYKNDAILFSAPSGTGKSTQSRLWTGYFDDCDYINDDKPVLSFENDQFFVYGNPWSGKTDLNSNVKIPLKAIIFVKQAKENFVDDLNNFSKLKYLMTNLGITDNLKDNDLILKYCNYLINSTEMYLLNCSISNQAILKVNEKLYHKVIK